VLLPARVQERLDALTSRLDDLHEWLPSQLSLPPPSSLLASLPAPPALRACPPSARLPAAAAVLLLCVVAALGAAGMGAGRSSPDGAPRSMGTMGGLPAWIGGGSPAAAAAAAAAAVDDVLNLQRRVRNVQSALAAMPLEWVQRSPLEEKLRQLSAELEQAVMRAERLRGSGEQVDVSPAHSQEQPSQQQPPLPQLTLPLAAPAPPPSSPRPQRRRPFARLLRRLTRLLIRPAEPSLPARAAALEDRLAQLERNMEMRAAGAAAAAAAAGAKAAMQLPAGSSVEVRLEALGQALGGRPWESGDQAIQAQLSQLQRALQRADSPSAEVDATGAVAALEARVEYLAAVLGGGPWSGVDLSTRLATLDAAAAEQAEQAELLSLQLRETAEAARGAVEALAARLAATEALAASLQEAASSARIAAAQPPQPIAARSYLEPQQQSSTTTRMDLGREILLQGFNWESHRHHGGAPLFRRLRDRVADVAAAGFTALWLPPCSQSLSPQGYMPQDFYNLNTAYGSETQLRELLADLTEAQILPLADVVLNHRCATKRGREGKWNRYEGMRMEWDESAITRNNGEWAGTGSWGTGEEWVGAPNIDHTNARVREDLKGLLAWLRTDVGFSGLRLDFTKGYAAQYAAEYVTSFGAQFAVGEFWQTLRYSDGALDWNQDAHRQGIVDWIDATGGACTAFDFTTKGILQEACARREWWRLRDASGRPPGVLGLWPSRAVTFIDNHDTGSTQAHWPFPADRVAQGYAYILTHPGTPCVLWDHLFEWGEEVRSAVRNVCAARRAAGVSSRSAVVIHQADAESYCATVGGTLALRLGGGGWAPSGPEWRHSCSDGTDGSHFCVWLRNKQS